MDKNISFDNTNSTNQIDLLYLTNMTTCKNNNEVKVNIVDKKEVEFYKKRIFQLCKDMLRNKETPPTVKDSFDYFCVNAIEYFKMMDKTEIIQKEYKTLNHDTESPTSLPNHDNKPSELSEDVNALMFKKIEKKDDKLDKFEHSRSVPFQPNSMFCTVNSKDSWHQAPTITEGIRKSLMLRFKV